MTIVQTFALDYDDTFTADPELWRQWIVIARSRGHSVYIVTARDNTESNLREIREATSLPVIMTGHQQKRQFCVENDVQIDVWIDDYPESICGDREALELAAAYDEVERLQGIIRELRQSASSASVDQVQAALPTLI